ncbi:unnamed protein product, partial [Prorocentrum cordatum]
MDFEGEEEGQLGGGSHGEPFDLWGLVGQHGSSKWAEAEGAAHPAEAEELGLVEAEDPAEGAADPAEAEELDVVEAEDLAEAAVDLVEACDAEAEGAVEAWDVELHPQGDGARGPQAGASRRPWTPPRKPGASAPVSAKRRRELPLRAKAGGSTKGGRG